MKLVGTIGLEPTTPTMSRRGNWMFEDLLGRTLTVAQLSGNSLKMIELHYGHLTREHARTALARLSL